MVGRRVVVPNVHVGRTEGVLLLAVNDDKNHNGYANGLFFSMMR